MDLRPRTLESTSALSLAILSHEPNPDHTHTHTLQVHCGCVLISTCHALLHCSPLNLIYRARRTVFALGSGERAAVTQAVQKSRSAARAKLLRMNLEVPRPEFVARVKNVACEWWNNTRAARCNRDRELFSVPGFFEGGVGGFLNFLPNSRSSNIF